MVPHSQTLHSTRLFSVQRTRGAEPHGHDAAIPRSNARLLPRRSGSGPVESSRHGDTGYVHALEPGGTCETSRMMACADDVFA